MLINIFQVLFTALGIAIAYFFAFGMNFVGGAIAWRLPIAAQILPAIVISIVLLGLPETPRWLIERGRMDEALEVMCQVYGTGPDDEYISTEKAAILEALEIENQNPFLWSNVFKKDRVQTGWRVCLAIMSLIFNQASFGLAGSVYHKCELTDRSCRVSMLLSSTSQLSWRSMWACRGTCLLLPGVALTSHSLPGPWCPAYSWTGLDAENR